MPNDLLSGGESGTGFAPPFRSLLGTPPTTEPPLGASAEGLPAVSGYEILSELGRGGMGIVYQARQCSLRRLVALKMILAGLHTDPTARLRFRTEAEAVARLSHPNIVQIHEVGEAAGRPFLCLEYLDGGSLREKAAGTPQPEREAAGLVETLARAVHYTHQHGILHRDLKPTNVLLAGDGTAKISDFGLARIVDGDLGPTCTESMLGTPSYMAPEQAAGDRGKVGPPADAYSLGAILYELLTGRPPFQGSSPLHTLEQARTQEPVPPRRLRRSLSGELEAICLKCLEKDPARRYASAEALADDLRCFLDGQPVRARPIPFYRRLWRSARRRAAPAAWALSAAALACLLLSGWWYFRTADQLARHRAGEQYQQFLQRRDEAYFHGLLGPGEGPAFLGGEAGAHGQRTETAAREALALAEDLPAARKAETSADCYALLLILAGLEAHQPHPSDQDKRDRETLHLLDRARRLGPPTRAYHLRRADVLERLGERGAARKDRALAASLPPEGALDHFLVGAEQYRRGDFRRATSAFNRALSAQPGHFWAEFFLAVCQLKVQNWEAARAGLNACLARQPDFVWAYLFRSFAHEKLQAVAEAEADFHNALRLGPNEDARHVLLLGRGILHFNQNDLERAAADFHQARAVKPGQYNAAVNLAHVWLARHDLDRAAEQFREAMRLRPPPQVVAGYHTVRGRCLLRDKRYEEAIRECQAALELSPRLALPHEVRGRALLALGRFEQAERAFDRYLQRGGNDGSDVFRGRGLARMKLGKYAEAVEDYTRALERAPDGAVYQHRGWAHFFSDAWKLAVRDFSRAIELDPRASDAWTGRGLARVMLGDDRAAVADAEAALRLGPRTPEMMHNIACLFAQAVARVGDDRPSLADDYRSRAVEAVRQTLRMVRPEERPAFWREKILPDAALTPIRDEAAFRRLQGQYERSR
jgi:tetratricopeptide (TPR) repeat protein